MISNSVLSQFVDYIVEHARLVNTSGFFNGRAGISLCLFEASRYLNNIYCEDQAFNLLQEALSDSDEDISFENGLSGIGYVLIYLMRNSFIEADFDEIFGVKLNKIVRKIDEMKELHSEKETFHYIRIAYFLIELNFIAPNKRLAKYIDFILERSAQFLEEGFSKINDHSGICSKISLLDNLKIYLKIVDECRYITPSFNLLNLYSELYLRGEFVSNYMIGYHLKNIISMLKKPYIEKVVIQNKTMALRDIYIKTMSLSQKIDLFNILLLDKHDEQASLATLLERDLLQKKRELFNWGILHEIPRTDSILVYQSRISRYVLYWIYKSSGNMNSQLFL